MGICQSPLCSPEASAEETRGCHKAQGHGKHPAQRSHPLLTPSPPHRAEPGLWMKAGSPLVLLVLLKAPARPKSAPAARPCFQEPDFHILQVRVGSEKLPAVTGNPGKSPNSSWPLAPPAKGIKLPRADGDSSRSAGKAPPEASGTAETAHARL